MIYNPGQPPSPNLLQDIIEEVPIRIFWKDTEGRYLGCNTLFAIDAGLSRPDELIGKTDFDMGWNDQAEAYRADDFAVMASGESKLGFEEPQTTPEGKTIWLRTSKVPLRNEQQQIIGILGIYEDITAQKQNETRFQSVIDASPVPFALNDSRQNIIYLNPAFTSTFGYNLEDIPTLEVWWPKAYPDSKYRAWVATTWQDRLDKSTREAAPFQPLELDIHCKDGSVRTAIVGASSLAGVASGIYLVTLFDITERKRSEQKLSESEKTYRGIFNSLSEAVYILDAHGSFLDVNEGAVRMYGFPRSYFIGKNPGDLSAPNRNDLNRVIEQLGLALHGVPQTLEFWALNSKGEEFPKEVHLYPGNYFGKQVVIAVATNISARKQQQALLESSRQRFQTLFDSSTDGIFVLDMQGNFIDINRTAYERLGYTKDELMAKNLSELDTPEFSAKLPDRFAEVVNNGTAIFESAQYCKNGSIMPIEANTRILDLDGQQVVFSHIRDIRERKELEEQLRQSQKMEAVGTLVGGIAHDFNNMLAAIQGNIYLAKLLLHGQPMATDKLDNIEKLGNRAADMVQQLLTFARKDSISMRTLSLNAFMKEGYKLATAAIPESIDHQTSVCNEALRIRGDITQLQQVLMNLLNNAVDAVSATPLPKIRCSLTRFESDKAFRARHPEMTADFFACISVKDNGHGIPADKLSKIFEPFYTTKEVGKGTGLGLAMLYGAIQTHGGLVEVESKVGRGTDFRVYLPLCHDNHAAETNSRKSTNNGSGETILLVDDEQTVRATTAEVLTRMGYHVLEAANGDMALDLFNSQRWQIKLIISDVIMPRMGGAELLKTVRQSGSELPFILITGYDKDNVLPKDIQPQNCLVLNKPFNFDALSESIQTMIRPK